MPSATGPAGPLVCVDFDDTLVENQAHFEQAASDLARLLRRELGLSEEAVRTAFTRVDAAHHHLGRNRNRFLLTLRATYAALGGSDALPLRLLPELAGIAAHPYDVPVTPLPGTVAALERLNLNLAVSGGRRCRRRTLPYERVRSWRGAGAWARRRRATPLRKSG